MELYWNHTSVWVLSCIFIAYVSEHLLLRIALKGCFCRTCYYSNKEYKMLHTFALKLHYNCSYSSSFPRETGENEGEGAGRPWCPCWSKEKGLFALLLLLLLLSFSKTCIWYRNSIFLISFLANSLSLLGNARSSSAIDATNLSSASISFFFALVSIFSLILLRSNTFSCSSLSDELIDNFLFWEDFCVLQFETATFSGKFSYY